MSEQTPPMPPMTRLPWPIMAAAILSLGTLVFTSHGAVPLAYIYIVALLATYFTSTRIEDGSPVCWFARIGLLGIAYASARLIEPNGGDYALLPAWMRSFFGLLYGGEMLIRVWRCKPGNSTDPIAVLFLSGLVFLTASNTFEDGYIRVVTPVYVLLLLLGLRSYRSLDVARNCDALYEVALTLQARARLRLDGELAAEAQRLLDALHVVAVPEPPAHRAP